MKFNKFPPWNLNGNLVPDAETDQERWREPGGGSGTKKENRKESQKETEAVQAETKQAQSVKIRVFAEFRRYSQKTAEYFLEYRRNSGNRIVRIHFGSGYIRISARLSEFQPNRKKQP